MTIAIAVIIGVIIVALIGFFAWSLVSINRHDDDRARQLVECFIETPRKEQPAFARQLVEGLVEATRKEQSVLVRLGFPVNDCINLGRDSQDLVRSARVVGGTDLY